MTYPEWPVALPYRPWRDQWSHVPGRESLKTELENGDTRQRRRPGDDVGAMQWGRTFTEAEMETWDDFLADTSGGVARFIMPVPTNGATYQLRVVQIVGGAGGVSTSAVGVETQVSFSLVVFPADMVPPTPTILSFDYLIYGTADAGTVDVEIDGVVRSAASASGYFAIDATDLAVGSYSVRIRYAGSNFGPAAIYTIGAAAGGHFDALSAPLYDVHSPMRVLTAWHGAVIRARRFDSVEKDFFGIAISPWLIDSAGMGIAEWSGVGSTYVAKCYGQKGASHDAVQATGAAQPRIVSAGVLDVGPNGRPQMVFSGAQYLDVENALGYSRAASALTIAVVVRATGASTQTVFTTMIAASTSSRAFLGYTNATTSVLQGRQIDGTDLRTATKTVSSGAWARLVSRARYAAGFLDLALDGGSANTAALDTTTAQPTPDTDSFAAPRIGATGSGSAPLTGGLSCAVLSRSALDMAALDAALAQVMP